jgi:hypothetical protein
MTTFATRRAALVGMACVLAAPLPAAALSPSDQALVDQAVTYLQSMKSVKGRFVQTDARGVAHGTHGERGRCRTRQPRRQTRDPCRTAAGLAPLR